LRISFLKSSINHLIHPDPYLPLFINEITFLHFTPVPLSHWERGDFCEYLTYETKIILKSLYGNNLFSTLEGLLKKGVSSLLIGEVVRTGTPATAGFRKLNKPCPYEKLFPQMTFSTYPEETIKANFMEN
jgi:hypothetical protein